MSEKNPQDDLVTRVLNRILVGLYLNSVAPLHPARAEKLRGVDELFGIERPSAPEMRQFIEELIKSGKDLDSAVRSRMVEELALLDEDFKRISSKELRSEGGARIKALFDAALDEENTLLSGPEQQRLLNIIVDDIFGFGPLEPYLIDDAVTEILIDGPNKIYVERNGRLEDASSRFLDDEHLMGCIHRIVAPLGRPLNKDHPIIDARLPDGSLVNVIIPPASLVGPVLTIRKFFKIPLTLEDLVRWGSISADMVEFLQACVRARLNIVIAGGTASGKITFTNLVAGMIPSDERIVTIESTAELQLPEHLRRVIRLESRPPVEGKGEVTVRDLVINSTRMRPDRIIFGEVHGAEGFDLLQAMNTGHDGTLFNIHANSPRDALGRLEMMAAFANPSMPVLMIRQMMASAIDLITYQERLDDGSRKVMKVSEVVGMQGDVVGLQDIFEFHPTGSDDKGKITGLFTPTGYVPTFLDRIKAAGIDLPPGLFTPK
jgi:pilus assembly protein CpaF